MKLNTKIDKGGWVDWEDDARFLLRPYPITKITSTDIDVKKALEMFQYCLIKWDGINDESDKPYPCNQATKKYVFDHVADLREFVNDEITKLMTKDDEDLGE